MKIYYSDARCGGGKTKWACEYMARHETKWLYVVDRRDVYDDRRQRIEQEALRFNTRPAYRTIRSGQGLADDVQDQATRNVRREIEYLPVELEHVDHAVCIITHEAMRSCDLSQFAGWSIIVDETPTIFNAESVRTPASTPFFEKTYTLEPFTDKWSRVKPVQGAVSMQEIAQDEIMQGWIGFHRRAISKEGVLVELQAWAEMSSRNWQWFSMWSPHELAAFDKRYFLANSFKQSICYKLIRSNWPEVEFIALTIPSSEVWKHRKVTIQYLVDKHTGGTNFWTKTPEGKECVKGWFEFVKANASPDGYWACNKKLVAPAGMPGKQVSTKISGSNAYRDCHEASVLYAAKAAPWERTLLRVWDIEPDDVIRAREYEDLIQILMRSSFRIPESSHDLIWTVYDEKQASFIAGYLISGGYNCTVTTEYVEAGINIEKKSKWGTSDQATEAEKIEKATTERLTRAERKRLARAAQKAQREAEGTYRPRGRPKSK